MRQQTLKEFEKVKTSTQDGIVIVDLYCGAGGVGKSIEEIFSGEVRHIGIDKEDFSDTYAGEFIQGDCSDIEWLTSILPEDIDLLWMSPPCNAYSTLSYCNKHKLGFDDPRDYYATFEDLNVHKVVDELNPSDYIIENVSTCEDLNEPVKLNGLAFGEKFKLERHFETSFPVPNKKEKGRPEVALSVMTGDDQSKFPMAEAKDVPSEWTSSAIRSAIPRVYVEYLIQYCGSVSTE